MRATTLLALSVGLGAACLACDDEGTVASPRDAGASLDVDLDAGYDASSANPEAGISDAAGSDTRVQTLATGQPGPWGVAVDGTHLYFTSLWDGTVKKVPLDGGDVALLATGPDEGSGIALDDEYVYWASSTTVLEVPLAGGAAIPIAENQSEPTGIAVSGARVYWTDYSSGKVQWVSLDGGEGGAPVLLAGSGDPWGIATDGTNVYWASGSGTILRVGVDGGTVETIADDQSQPTGITVHDGVAYWTNYTGGTVVGKPLDGGAIVTFASGQDHPWGICVDGDDVYWSTAKIVAKARLDGGGPTTIASDQASPSGIAIDDGHVYWANNGDGTIVKAAK